MSRSTRWAGPTPDAPVGSWSPDELTFLASTHELLVGMARLPIWVVVADGEVFVRTWHLRQTGWYGRAVRTGRLTVEVLGRSVEASVDVVADADAAEVDTAYVAKYGAGGARSMVTAEAVASTLRLSPVA